MFTNEFLERTGLGRCGGHGIAEGTEFVADAIPKLDGKLIEGPVSSEINDLLRTTEMPAL